MTFRQLVRIFSIALLPFPYPLANIAQIPATPNPPGVIGQNGVVQEPLRQCVLHNFGVAAGDPSQFMVNGELTAITQGSAGAGGSQDDKDFYGTTLIGGKFGRGTVYKIPYQNGTIKSDDSSTVLYEFDGLADGGAPEGGVVLGSDGYLYGTTMGGGGFDAGTICKISRSGGPPQFKTIYSFGSVKITTPLSNNPATHRAGP